MHKNSTCNWELAAIGHSPRPTRKKVEHTFSIPDAPESDINFSGFSAMTARVNTPALTLSSNLHNS